MNENLQKLLMNIYLYESLNISEATDIDISGNFETYVKIARAFVDKSFEIMEKRNEMDKISDDFIIDSGLQFYSIKNGKKELKNILFVVGEAYVDDDGNQRGKGGLHMIDRHLENFKNMIKDIPANYYNNIVEYSSSVGYTNKNKEDMLRSLLLFPYAIKYGSEGYTKRKTDNSLILYNNSLFVIGMKNEGTNCELVTMYSPTKRTQERFKAYKF